MWQLHRRVKCAHHRSRSSYCVAVLSPCTPPTHTHKPEAQISGRGGRKDGLIISVAMCWSNTMPDLRNGPGTKPVIIKLCLWLLKPHRRRSGGYSRWLISTLMAKQKHLLTVQVSGGGRWMAACLNTQYFCSASAAARGLGLFFYFFILPANSLFFLQRERNRDFIRGKCWLFIIKKALYHIMHAAGTRGHHNPVD